MDRTLLRPAKVCERLAISNNKMHALIAAGELEAVTIGPNGTRVYARSVEALLQRNVIKNTEGA